MFGATTTETCKMDDFLQRLNELIVLYRPAISESDSRKTGPYQMPYHRYWEELAAAG